jgi:hypothetical protein
MGNTLAPKGFSALVTVPSSLCPASDALSHRQLHARPTRKKSAGHVAQRRDAARAINADGPTQRLDAFQDLRGADPSVGKRIGPYQFVREIGSGGMGEVYLAMRVDAEFRRDSSISNDRLSRG